MPRHNWRWWFHVIHRDIGYLCVGLVLVYAISGIAVNHVADWNPNYAIERLPVNIGPVPQGDDSDEAVAQRILTRLQLPTDYKTLYVPEPGRLHIIRVNHTIEVELATGEVVHEVVVPRPVIHQTNQLHLNHHKGVWTFVADAFAVALALLAISGMFLIKGRKGLPGRGKWLVAAGVLLPLLFLWIYN